MYTHYQSPERDSYIDALKGWSILGVIMAHSGLWGQGKAAQFAVSGSSLCQLFFIISAFLMFKSYNRFILQGHSNTAKDSLYWILKKFIRLIPLWYLSIAVHMLTNGQSPYWLGSVGRVTPLNLLAHIFFLHSFFPYYMDSVTAVDWYIGDIAVLIVLIPLIHKSIKSLSSAILCFLGTVVVVQIFANCLINLSPLPQTDTYLWNAYVGNFGIWNQIPVMLLGIILYFLLEKLEKYAKAENPKLMSIALLCTGLVFLYGIIFKGTSIWFLNTFTLFGIPYAIIFISQSICSLTIVNNPVTRTLGKYSYGIYLFHYGIVIRIYNAIAPVTENVRLNSILRIIIVTSVSLGLSILLTKFIEKPLVTKWNHLLKRSRLANFKSF